MHRLSFAIEEALRLCSLPGENEGRVYYFRHMQFRGLPAHGDRCVWLKVFERTMITEAANAVHGITAYARTANAVFFQNEQEACELLLSRILRGQPADAWFWSSVSGSAPGVNGAAHLESVIEKLRASEASWFAVAGIIFASEDYDGLLNLLSATMARRWLDELQIGSGLATVSAPSLPRFEILRMIQRALTKFGADDPRAVWIAALALILTHPSMAETGVAVPQAQMILDALQPAATVESSPPALAAAASCAGERTEGAGLFFLLNALRMLRLSETSFTPVFLAHFFLRASRHAGISEGDPILLPMTQTIDRIGAEPLDERRLRLWLRKVRRWCWRHGKIGLREVIRRPGRVTLTRTDLDISLPLDSADIRIRRIGLDLNPGWLPWFGRVVRFHYLDRGDFHG